MILHPGLPRRNRVNSIIDLSPPFVAPRGRRNPGGSEEEEEMEVMVVVVVRETRVSRTERRVKRGR